MTIEKNDTLGNPAETTDEVLAEAEFPGDPAGESGLDDGVADDADELEEDAEPDDSDLPDESAGRTNALWEGDTGELAFNVRRVLVALLRGPCLRRDRHPRLWRTLLANEDVVRSRACDLFLELLLDEDSGVAMMRRAPAEDLQAPSLLHTVRLNFLDSCALLELREKIMRSAAAAGERCVVTTEEIAESLKLYDRTVLRDEQAFRRHVSGVIRRLTARRLLLPLRGGVMEVSPALPRLFTADDVAALKAAYLEKANRVGRAELEQETNEETGGPDSPDEMPNDTDKQTDEKETL